MIIISGDAISQHLLLLFDNYGIGCLRKTVKTIYFVCLFVGGAASFVSCFFLTTPGHTFWRRMRNGRMVKMDRKWKEIFFSLPVYIPLT